MHARLLSTKSLLTLYQIIVCLFVFVALRPMSTAIVAYR